MPIQIAKVREFKGHTQAIYTMCIGSEPGSFFSAGADGRIAEWSVEKTDGVLFAKPELPVYSLYVRENIMLSGTSTGQIIVFDIADRSMIKTLQFHHSAIFDINCFNNQFLVVHENGYFSVFDSAFNLLQDIRISHESLRKILIVGHHIYISGREGIIWKMNENYELTEQIKADDITVFSMALHDESNLLLTGGRSAKLKIWRNSEMIQEINAHLLHIKDIAFSPGQQYFTTCSMDKTIKLWDAGKFELLKVIDFEKYEAHRSSVNKILWIGRNRFISCSDDRTLMCFEIKE